MLFLSYSPVSAKDNFNCSEINGVGLRSINNNSLTDLNRASDPNVIFCISSARK
jgi:hypothetical protein